MYRFFSGSENRAGNPVIPPTRENFDFVVTHDAGRADRLKRNARRMVSKKRTTVTLTILLLVSQSPIDSGSNDSDNDDDDDNAAGAYQNYTFMSSTESVLSASPLSPSSLKRAVSFASVDAKAAANSIVVGSPVAATRFIRSSTGGEPKISMFCTVPAQATPDQVVELVEADLLRFHHRKLLHPRDYYVLHPALEGQGALDRSRRPLHGGQAPLLDGLGPFPFCPLALVPSVFAAERLQIETRLEPQRRMVVYHERLLLAQHLGRMSQLYKEVANLSAGTAARWWQEWVLLKNAEIDQRTGIGAWALRQQETAGREAILVERDVLWTTMDVFGTDVQSFFDDCVFLFRRSNAAFEATRVIMARARTECMQRVACRERWEGLVKFYDTLWSQTQFYVRNLYTQSRLSLEIVTATLGEEEPRIVATGKTTLMVGVGAADDDDNDNDDEGQKNEKKQVLHSTLLCTTTDSSLGATQHAVKCHRSRRLVRMAQEQDAAFRLIESASPPPPTSHSIASPLFRSSEPSRHQHRSKLCSTSVLCGDPLASTIFK